MNQYFYNMTEFLNQIPDLGLILAALAIFFAYKKFSGFSYFILLTLYLLKLDLSLNSYIIYFAVSAILLIPFLRANIITRLLICLISKLGLLPKISQTEKMALTSGNVWIDGDLFSGKPDFKKIFSQKYPTLTPEEKSFLDNEVEEVCKICDDYEVHKQHDLPKEVWEFLAKKKFFGMIIPKKFGGLEFSAYAHGCVVEKLASRSVPLSITVMVPNSLGPAELLLHYGTENQRNYYLPRLADGRELPCFALTEPTVGSDATSIKSNGVLFKDSDGEIKIRLNFNKRYITLGAYATIIGVAFKLYDPQRLLSDNEDLGITCALIPNTTKGVRQGRRHDPLSTPFVNSPLNGEDVIIGLEAVIGGAEGVGQGWKMLVECLSAGRGISLPSTSAGGSKLVVRALGAYSAVRHQFNTAIGKFEGVEEVLARIISRTYAIDAMRRYTAGAIDSGSKPAVITAIAKYHATEMFRQNVNDGMDIMGGSAIIRGRRNILANPYFSTPISITVEGANIMTRSLIHFGQGAIMCHPHVYKEIEALEKGDVYAFDREFFKHINHLVSNFVRSILLSLTRGHFKKPFKCGLAHKYERKIAWCSATFAFLADIALAKFGGNLKRKEKLNGRFGDALSAMYFATCILKKYQEGNKSADETAIVKHALQEQFGKAQVAIEGLYENLFGCFTKMLIWPFIFVVKSNRFACAASDDLGHDVVKNFIKNSTIRDEVTQGIFISSDKNDNLGRLENALKLHEASHAATAKIKAAVKNKILPNKKIEDLTDLALVEKVISAEEKNIILAAQAAMLDAVQVDEYSLEDYKKI
jgi:acyl-CoA dehydrogenase